MVLWFPGQALAGESATTASEHLKGKYYELELSVPPGPLQTTPTNIAVKVTELGRGTPLAGAVVVLMAHPPELAANHDGHQPAPGQDSGHDQKAPASHVDLMVRLTEASGSKDDHRSSGGHGDQAASAGTGIYGGRIHLKQPGRWVLEIMVEKDGRNEVFEFQPPVLDSGPNKIFLGITGGLMLVAMATSVILKLSGKAGRRNDA